MVERTFRPECSERSRNSRPRAWDYSAYTVNTAKKDLYYEYICMPSTVSLTLHHTCGS
jgi:hypothetical protein